MIYFWIAVGILDLFIILMLAILIKIALRKTPDDIRTRALAAEHPLYPIQQAVLREQAFFTQHRGELLVIQANGVELAAKKYTPDSPIGRVLLFHGYRSIPETDFAGAVQAYYSRGYEVVLADQRAHGKSSGWWIGFGVQERYDCLSWVRYLNHEHGILPTFLGGVSMGSTTVLLASALELPSNVKGIIADCGFTSPKEIINHVMKRKKHPARILLPALDLFFRIFAGYSIHGCSTVTAMQKNTIPILFIHGKEDHFVPLSMTTENYQACAAEKELLLIEGAGHGTSFLHRQDQAEPAIAAFLEKYNR